MKRKTKALVSIGTILLTNLVLPRLFVWLAPADVGMALCFLLFFIGIPATDLFLGILAGSEMKKLWWIPVAAAVSFPFLFSLAMWELVMDLMVYAVFYLCIGVTAMVVTHFCRRYMENYKK